MCPPNQIKPRFMSDESDTYHLNGADVHDSKIIGAHNAYTVNPACISFSSLCKNFQCLVYVICD